MEVSLCERIPLKPLFSPTVLHAHYRELVSRAEVLVAAVRSRQGPSFAVVSSIPHPRFEPCLAVGLYTEWQEVLTRPTKLWIREVERVHDEEGEDGDREAGANLAITAWAMRLVASVSLNPSVLMRSW
jgi:hypothetical protein